MIVLGISGSPREGGNTDTLLEQALSGAKSKGASVEKIVLNNLNFSPCQECNNVREDGVCTVKDDMQTVYAKIESAGAIILASPIFFGSLSAQTKMMIDRFQCLWLSEYVFKTRAIEKNKNGAFICVEASTRKDFFENAPLYASRHPQEKIFLRMPNQSRKTSSLPQVPHIRKNSCAQVSTKKELS
jgi:multimeric flavodoxin WrbA